MDGGYAELHERPINIWGERNGAQVPVTRQSVLLQQVWTSLSPPLVGPVVSNESGTTSLTGR